MHTLTIHICHPITFTINDGFFSAILLFHLARYFLRHFIGLCISSCCRVNCSNVDFFKTNVLCSPNVCIFERLFFHQLFDQQFCLLRFTFHVHKKLFLLFFLCCSCCCVFMENVDLCDGMEMEWRTKTGN